MTNQEREQWLASLKVGDEVCFHCQYNGYRVLTIEKITPKRQIKTAYGYTFKNGVHRTDAWSSYTLEPVTEEVKRKIKHKKLISKVTNRGFNFSMCNIDQLERIVAIMEEVDAD